MRTVIAIVGPRSFSDAGAVGRVCEDVLQAHFSPEEAPITIISGGARGVDTLAKEFFERYEWPIERVVSGTYAVAPAVARPYSLFVEISPNYRRYLSKSAPFKRNLEVVAMCTELWAIVPSWWSNEGGTGHTVQQARVVGRPVHVRRI